MSFHMSHMCFFFFFQAEDGIRDVAVTGVQTCALPISSRREVSDPWSASGSPSTPNSISWRRIQTSWRCSHKPAGPRRGQDRKSTRLNSSHGYISYAVFCLKKKKRHRSDQFRVDSLGTRHTCHHDTQYSLAV